MTAYRDDLEAAIAHADAAERELAKARDELAADHERIAELERELAAAKRGVNKAKRVEPKPAPPPRQPRAKTPKPKPVVAIALGVVAGVAVIVGMIFLIRWRNAPSYPVVDLVADEPAARALATDWLPDAELFELRADYVDPRGTSDLARYGGGRVYLSYRSPSRAATSAPASSEPIGAPTSDPDAPICIVEVRFDGRRRRASTTNGRGSACGTALPTPVRCTVVDVWTEAIRRGAPENALASIRLKARTRAKRERATWTFEIDGKGGRVFEMELFDDECPWSGTPPILRR
jgi:hypothetical protein